MKVFKILGFMCLFSLSLNAEKSIKDYSIPESSAEVMTGTANLKYNGVDTMITDIRSIINYNGFFSSMNLVKKFDYSLLLDYNDKDPIKENKSLGLDFSSNNNLNKYFNEKSSFFYDFTFNTNISYRNKPNSYSNASLQPQIGIGYGRIVDVTSITKALRIQEYLLEDKLVTTEFTNEELNEIANHIYKFHEYNVKEKKGHLIEFYSDFEKILVNTGKLIDGKFSPFTILRINEVLSNENIYFRQSGWTFSFGLNEKFSVSKSIQFQNIYKKNDLGIYINFNFGYPISNKLQFNQNAKYELTNTAYLGNEEWFSSNRYINSFYLKNSLTYEITNKIDINFEYGVSGVSYDDFSTVLQYLNASYIYYLEHHIYLTFNTNLSYWNSSSFLYENNKKLSKSFSIDFGYRFF